MANRQALRELQTRLAEKLQIARTQGVAASWLAIEAGGDKYLFPLSQSGEIFPWVSTQPVPYTQTWFAGVANLRGGLFGVVDLASFVSGQTPRIKNELWRTSAMLVSLNSALEVNCALAIDKLAGLRNQKSFVDYVEKAPHSPDFFSNQYIDLHGATWQEINLQTLAQHVRFLTVSV